MTKPDLASLEKTIDKAFDERDGINTATRGEVREAVEQSLVLLDRGEARVAEKQADGNWQVNQWLKKAVLLSFRLNPMEVIKGGPGQSSRWDKVPSKFDGWTANEFEKAGFRAVPNCIVRHSAYIAPNAILMPSFVNLGAYVDEGTMVDTGHRRLLRTDRQERSPFRRRRHRRCSGADAGRSNHHRGQLFHRRPFGSR